METRSSINDLFLWDSLETVYQLSVFILRRKSHRGFASSAPEAFFLFSAFLVGDLVSDSHRFEIRMAHQLPL